MVNFRPYIFFGLNVVRFLSIVSMILVFASSIFVIVKDVEAVNNFSAAKLNGSVTDEDLVNCDYIEDSTVPNQIGGVFWAVVNRLLIIFQVLTLILSEVGWPSAFFDRFFPVLGPSFGLGALGIFQGLIGASVLSQHVDDFTLVAAFFLFVLGCLNMLLGLVFRESAKERRSITAWRGEKRDVLPTTAPGSGSPRGAMRPLELSRSGSTATWVNDEKPKDLSEFGVGHQRTGSTMRSGYGFGRQGEKAAGLKGYLITRPTESLPRYASRPRSGASQPASSRSASPEPTDERRPHFASSTTSL
ncbi:hypothetical protein CONPUDRAFT_134679 [Coniophora puteana RWD-64-598 SS2]|uniref:DUF7598 domain-containing protein n=1 Tax=Coniophora puteana (strain RWD-64-598) TaxID=741705 RepID=A0A5M3N1M0_CONPW|nr:uncharacterized protein CONPUDRAFT_134679 [Coniophora puteana RWD-64-598 SS2]EIW84771.1 hypothetical protein CONPUDRAFT_134679 [Coniophora puteana RWD-64-598 SS2]